MKLKNISYKGLFVALIGGFILITVSLSGIVGSAYAVDVSVSFSPATDAVVQDPTTNLTISFDQAVYADTDGTPFTSTTLANVVSLHTTNAEGTAIPFAASINSDNTIITLDPNEQLADGAVYIAISDGYYDSESTQGSAANAIFFIAAVPADTPPVTPPADTTAPTVNIVPADASTVTDASRNITLTFSEAVYKDTEETAFVAADLTSILTLKTTDTQGDDIAYTASINAENTIITIDPTADLANNSTVYVALTDGYYDAADNQGAEATSTFTVAVPAPETPADTIVPVVTITPADGATITDASKDINLSFSEAIYQNVDGDLFDATALANLVTLKVTDTNGADIPYTASINAENTVVIVNPTADFTNGTVYVALTDGYYDAADNQGAEATSTFTVAIPDPVADTTAPTVNIVPADASTVTDASRNITLTFSEAVYKDTEETAFVAADLTSILTLKTTDTQGDDIAYTASINAENTIITIDPTADLANNSTVYVALTDGYYDAADNQGATATSTFTVETTPVEEEVTAQTAPSSTDTIAPIVRIIPADGDTVINAARNITLTFSEAVYKDTEETAFVAADLTSILTLKTTDTQGDDIAYTASINAENTIITIDPTADLANNSTVYVALTDGYYDAADNQGAEATSTFTVAVPAPETPADTIVPVVTITPADGATITDASKDINLSFSEAIYQNVDGDLFDATALANLVTLKVTDTNGADIPYTASINAENTVVIVNPTADFTNGTVYVALTDGYYDAADNQGAEATSTFTVAIPAPDPVADTTAPTVNIVPADASTVTDASRNITLTFSEAVYKDTEETAFVAADLTSILTLKTTDTQGDDIAYTASINAENTIITIDPTADLANNSTVYVALTDGYYDAADNQGATATSTFTVAAPAQLTVTISPADDEIITDNTTNITLTFNRPVYQNINEAPFTSKNLASFVVLRTDDVYGYGIPFVATMSTDNTIITVDPIDNMYDGDVYVAISADYYDADDTRGTAAKATFTVDAGVPREIDNFFSRFFLAPPLPPISGSNKTTFGDTFTLPIHGDEITRQQKIEEALSLLWRALESLSIAVAMDPANNTPISGIAEGSTGTTNTTNTEALSGDEAGNNTSNDTSTNSTISGTAEGSAGTTNTANTEALSGGAGGNLGNDTSTTTTSTQ